jgi:hypothetical protein
LRGRALTATGLGRTGTVRAADSARAGRVSASFFR